MCCFVNAVPLPPAFWCAETEVHLSPGVVRTVEIEVLPLQPVSRHCCILLVSPQLGDFVYSLQASVSLPLPISGADLDDVAKALPQSLRTLPSTRTQAAPSSVLSLHYGDPSASLEEQLLLCAVNPQREQALMHRRKWNMTAAERNRRLLAGTMLQTKADLASSHLVETTAFASNKLSFAVSCDSTHFLFDEHVTLPLVEYGMASGVAPHHDVSLATALPATTTLPMVFLPQGPGRYPCNLMLWSVDDVRIIQLEVIVNSSPDCAEVLLHSPAGKRLIQNLPIVSDRGR